MSDKGFISKLKRHDCKNSVFDSGIYCKIMELGNKKEIEQWFWKCVFNTTYNHIIYFCPYCGEELK